MDEKESKIQEKYSMCVIKLLRNLNKYIEVAYHYRGKDYRYYFWKKLVFSLIHFFEHKALNQFYQIKSESSVDRDDDLWDFPSAFIAFVDAINNACGLWNNTVNKFMRDSFLRAEARLHATYARIRDVVWFKEHNQDNPSQDSLPWKRPWSLAAWQYSDEENMDPFFKRTNDVSGRAEDIIFWPRFFSETETKDIPFAKFQKALWLHIMIVEKQTITVPEKIFSNMIHNACFGKGPDPQKESIISRCRIETGNVNYSSSSRASWYAFIKKYGPSLENVYNRVIGATLVRPSSSSSSQFQDDDIQDGDMVDWIVYDADNEVADALLKANVGGDDMDEGEEGDEQDESDPGPQVNFLFTLARNKENFLLHYWKHNEHKETLDQTRAALFLDKNGYYFSHDNKKHYPDIRTALLDGIVKLKHHLSSDKKKSCVLNRNIGLIGNQISKKLVPL